MAVCKRCGQEKSQQDFPALSEGKYLCRDCLIEVNREARNVGRDAQLSSTKPFWTIRMGVAPSVVQSKGI